MVAMYHDQGHIPMKLLAFDSGVNVSLGLPIIRTSVDHGTAFDIAGTGRASEASLLAAIEVAVQMVDLAVDIDEGPATAQKFQIRGVPTLLVIKDGKVVGQQVGAAPKAKIEALMEGAL